MDIGSAFIPFQIFFLFFQSLGQDTNPRHTLVLKTYFSRFLTTGAEHLFRRAPSMVAYDNVLWEKQYVIFRQILIPLEKTVYAPVYSLFEILSTEIFSNNLLQTLCYLIVRRVIKREGFRVDIYIEPVLINGAK